MSEQQGKELLTVMGEILLEHRMTNDRLERIEHDVREIRSDIALIKRVVYAHEQRLKALEHE
jgi:hypothetical protein